MACHLILISTFGNSVGGDIYDFFSAAGEMVIYLCLVNCLFYLTLKDSSVSFKDLETCCVIDHL